MTAMSNRTDPERHREQVAAANRARYKAERRLIAEKQERWQELYSEQARLAGVEPRFRRTEEEELEQEIERLQKLLAKATRTQTQTDVT